ncbi:hypothetical protein PU629_06460 [Pullulanibacillus sp. KACC 23026]|uniref:hypothetical protein n=1 Tax=Pullulanibacillus sp. KACC 23026 TaxID=3028315 RepID=UPI0023AF3B5D|nr:hypothetical protein [Pullulanibacillus sp. KACC 23026]WEG14007.1 hypothetical protein PU629_06460 [Pullulanibacillus sp. KACC 23026]
MTPHELNIKAEIFAEKSKVDQEEKLLMAYMTARWQRVDKLESFKHYIDEMKQNEDKQEEKPMTDLEMLVKVQQLNAAMGGSVK